MPVCFGEVSADADAFLTECIKHGFHDIRILVLMERAVLCGCLIIGIFRIPEAESVVVLGRQHDHAEPGVLEHLDPLVGVDRRREEEVGRLPPVAPLLTREGIDREVDEGRQLPLLPGQLLGRRHQVRGHLDLGQRIGIAQIDVFLIIGFRRSVPGTGAGATQGDGTRQNQAGQ